MDNDLCLDCPSLTRPQDARVAPYCARAAHPRQMGCTRYPPPRGAPAAHDGELPPARGGRRTKGGRRG